MQLTVRTVASGNYELLAELTETVLGIKEKLSSQHNAGPAANMRLIYQGRVLTDPLTLAEVGMRESEFLVLMITKPKAGDGAAPTAPTATPSAEPSPAPAPP